MFINMFKKKPAIRNSSESSHTSNLSDGVSGDHQVIGKPREAVVQDDASLWDCRDRILLSVRKIKTKDQVEKEIDKDKSNTRLEEAPIIVEEFQSDITSTNLKVSVSSQTSDQLMGTVVTFKSMADKSQQMSSESCVKRVEKNTILLPVIEPNIIESDESYTSTEEYSTNSSIVHKSCQLQTSTKFPKHLNWILSPSYCSNSTCHWYPCDENIVPVHKIAFAVMVLTSLVLKTRQWLERCLQYTNHQVVTQRSETQFSILKEFTKLFTPEKSTFVNTPLTIENLLHLNWISDCAPPLSRRSIWYAS
ncbi:uncharacterized protein LOC114131983 isoform X3 [Aphis gossypii]|uniref:uncharacterized protein LOC114131983 isoform X3 n=1 Tax=Aphis gossypii TaxID=80765 RepID=UPI0021595524|nr:uncharacterized protein LOC114131983 isoform X3 [Aphis gossypii]